MSGFLLDTNVISELIKPKPEPEVTRWIAGTDEELLFLSVLTIGEIRKGIAAHPNAARRTRLEAWLSSDLLVRFAGRVLPVDTAVAERWGSMMAQAERAGRRLPVIDGLLAATAQHHDLTFVTRNTEDVEQTGVPVYNPWPG